MRVLFQNRSDVLTKRGGDTTQMLKTKEGLERLGLQVDVILDPVTDYHAYDLVHLFNIQTFLETRPQLERAKSDGRTVALSTIWWRMTEFEIHRLRRPGWNQLRRVVGTRLAGAMFERWVRARRPHFDAQSWLLRNADVLLPNSNAEAELLMEHFALSRENTHMQVVHNAIDKDIFKGADPQLFASKHGLRDFVVCAGRIENRKNQINLIRAMREIGVPLVLIGQPSPNQEDYVSLCRSLAAKMGTDRVWFIDHLDAKELASAYAAAKVHALVSWLESPGLATMEAAVAGCNVVTTDRAPVDEYFGNLAWRCDPSSVRSIRDAIRAALAAPRQTALRDKIVSDFTWDRAARETLQGYEMALRRRRA